MFRVKWILFDFGGCLDSDGVHSRTLFFNQFTKLNLIKTTDNYNKFQEAYTYSDQKVIKEGLVVDASLLEMNNQMCIHIAEKLSVSDSTVVSKVALAITDIQSAYLRRNNKILKLLSRQYRLGIISNFSGNLKIILNEFSLNSHFDFVLDSYHLGISKPNPEIFKIAIEHCRSDSFNICFVGDNPDNDITPAKNIGMRTILLSPNTIKSNADYTLASLEDLLVFTQIT